MTTREALNVMLIATADKAIRMSREGYSDSDYDVMENYLTITNALLGADYDDAELPSPEEACWCPDEVIQFLKENHA